MRHIGEADCDAFVVFQQIEGLADAGEHAKRQHIDLHQAERVDVVLVPFDEGAIRHRGIADGHQFIEPLAREHEAADMLRQVARKPDEAFGKAHGPRDRGVVRIEACLLHLIAGDVRAPAAPLRAGKGRRNVLRKPEHLARLADSAFGAIVNDGGGQAGPLAAITRVDVLDDLLASFMLEIDIDIRRLAPLFRDEACEQHVVLGRIDAGDAEHIADGRIRGRAAPLAQDAHVVGHAHDVVDGEEIAGVVELADQREFGMQQALHLVRRAGGIAHRGVPPGEFLQPALRVAPRRDWLVRILVAELAQIEADAGQQLPGLADGLRVIGKKPGHFRRMLEVPFGVHLEQAAGILKRAAFPDAGEDVLQVALRRLCIEHVVGGNERRVCGLGDAGEFRQLAPVITPARHARTKPERARRGLAEAVQQHRKPAPVAPRHRDEQKVARIGDQIAQLKLACAFPRAAIAEGEKPAEPPPAGPVFGIGDDVRRAVREGEARAGDEPESLRPCLNQRLQGGVVSLGERHRGGRQALRFEAHLAGP